MWFLDKRIDFQDDLFNKQAIIIKRSPVYLYKVVIYSLLLVLWIVGLFYINFISDFKWFIYNILITLLIFFQFILIVRYVFIFNKNFKIYYLYWDKDKLIQNRRVFKKVMIFFLSVFFLSVILVFINIYISFLNLGFLLWIFSLFVNLTIIYFELDLIVFDDYWIRKFVNSSIRFVSPYYLSKLEIWNIYVQASWLINSIFGTGTITVVNNELVKRHFEYISTPDKIYEIIKKLVKSGKKDKVNYEVRDSSLG